MATERMDEAGLAAFLEVAREAADRWDDRRVIRRERTEAVEQKDYLRADSPDRLSARISRLQAEVGLSAAEKDVRPAEMPAPSAADLERMDRVDANRLVEEAIIDARDFLSAEFLDRGVVAARTVGRVVVRTGAGPLARGTGFLVAPGVLLTNNHVLRTVEEAARCAVEMDYVAPSDRFFRQRRTFALEPDRLFLTDRPLDFTLVAVAALSESGDPVAAYGYCPLDGRVGKVVVSDRDFLNIVQHPLGRPKEIVVRENRVLDLETAASGATDFRAFIHYQGDTERGSSGSPVFNDQWEVIALHHSGVPARDADGNILDRDGRRWNEATQSVSEIRWDGNEGIRVSSLVGHLDAVQLAGEPRALVQAVLGGRFQAGSSAPAAGQEASGDAAAPPRRPAPPEVQPDRAGPDGELVVEVPIRIRVSVGAPHPVGARAAAAAPGGGSFAVAEDGPRPDPTKPAAAFAGRVGYRPDFLPTPVPLPRVKANPKHGGALLIPRPTDPGRPTELLYTHYSVIMNAGRRLAYLSAANLDFGAAVQAPRPKSDTWFLDGRLDPDQQLGNLYYFGTTNRYDRGHLARRDDVAWGATEDEARQGNLDSFHYPNSAPQHEDFNRSDVFTGKHLQLWGDLENHISKQGDAQRARLSVFNGPIFTGTDKPLKDALVPRAYFKIVVWQDEGEEPGAAGFVLEQDELIARLPEEAIDPGAFRLRQKRIAAIQRSTDLLFAPITRFDRFRPRPADEALEAPSLDEIEIDSFDDLCL